MTKKIRVLIILNLFLASAAFAQSPQKFFAGSMPVVPNGATTNSQTAQLLIDDNGSLTPSGLFVTASLSNQQYVGLNTTPDNAVVMFGATNNPGSSVTSRPVFTSMTEIGSATNGMFSNNINGISTGIDVTDNYAFNLFSSIQHFGGLPAGENGVPATDSRVYFADLTLTFSGPVTNPFIHLVALGGRSTAGLGFSSEFDLVTPGITLQEVTGTPIFAVTPTQIKSGNFNAIDESCPNSTAACGTVKLNGANITAVTFKVFVRGDGRNATTWALPTAHSGDQWMVGVSLPGSLTTTAAPVTISGRVLAESGRGISGARITLVDSSGNVRIAVTNSLGYYSFSDLDAGETVFLEISHKRYRFDNPAEVHTPVDDLFEINFVGSPPSQNRER